MECVSFDLWTFESKVGSCVGHLGWNQSLRKTSKKNHKAMEIFRELPIRAFKKIPPKVSLDAGRVGG